MDEKQTWHLKMGFVLVSEPACPSFDDSFFVFSSDLPCLTYKYSFFPLFLLMLPGEWPAAADDE